MSIIRTLLILLEAASSLALIGLVLLQKSKSDGLGAAFGGGGNDSLLGARAGNVLTKATVGIGIAFLVNTLVLGILFSGSADQSLMADADLPIASAPAVAVPATPEIQVSTETPISLEIPASTETPAVPSE